MSRTLLGVIVLWAFTTAVILFLIFLGLSLVGASLPIETIFAAIAVMLMVIFTFRFYRGLRANLAKAKTGREVIIGAIGIATTNLTPKGEVRVLGEFWQAIAKEDRIEKGSEVKVISMDNLTLYVIKGDQNLALNQD